MASGTTSDAMAQIESFTAAGILAIVPAGSMGQVSLPMRRVLTFLLAAALLLASLGIGVFTADLPFWRRAFQLPLPPDGAYLPVARIGNAGADAARSGCAGGVRRSMRPAVEGAASRARNAGSRALLVMYRGRLEIERYFAADDARSLVPAGLIARPLAAMAVGQAIAGGRIRSLDAPVARISRRMGRRAARQDHPAPVARGDQRTRDRRRHPGCSGVRRGTTWRGCRPSRPARACACC